MDTFKVTMGRIKRQGSTHSHNVKGTNFITQAPIELVQIQNMLVLTQEFISRVFRCLHSCFWGYQFTSFFLGSQTQEAS